MGSGSQNEKGASPLRAGLVGLGQQGNILAQAMLDRGVSLTVYDPRPEAMAALASRGAAPAAGLGELARSVDVAMVCVRDDRQVEEAVLGKHGLLGALRAGTIIVIHSTVSPALVSEIASRAAAKGVTVVDAPVSGGHPGSPAPLSYMVGGSPDAVRACLPFFGGPEGNVTLTGDSGSGMKTKLVHQLVLCVSLLAAGEGGTLADMLGIDPGRLASALRKGTAGTDLAARLTNALSPSGAAELLVKDLELCRALAADKSLKLPGAEAALAMLRERLESDGSEA